MFPPLTPLLNAYLPGELCPRVCGMCVYVGGEGGRGNSQQKCSLVCTVVSRKRVHS